MTALEKGIKKWILLNQSTILPYQKDMRGNTWCRRSQRAVPYQGKMIIPTPTCTSVPWDYDTKIRRKFSLAQSLLGPSKDNLLFSGSTEKNNETDRNNETDNCTKVKPNQVQSAQAKCKYQSNKLYFNRVTLSVIVLFFIVVLKSKLKYYWIQVIW